MSFGLRRLTLFIEGIEEDPDAAHRIEQYLLTSQGVLSAKVLWEQGTAEVAYDPSSVKEQDIANAVSSFGYYAEVKGEDRPLTVFKSSSYAAGSQKQTGSEKSTFSDRSSRNELKVSTGIGGGAFEKFMSLGSNYISANNSYHSISLDSSQNGVLVSGYNSAATTPFQNIDISEETNSQRQQGKGQDADTGRDYMPNIPSMLQMRNLTWNKAVLGIDNMTSLNCASTVEFALNGMDGVAEVKAVLSSRTVSFRYDSTVISAGAIANELRSAGFSVEILLVERAISQLNVITAINQQQAATDPEINGAALPQSPTNNNIYDHFQMKSSGVDGHKDAGLRTVFLTVEGIYDVSYLRNLQQSPDELSATVVASSIHRAARKQIDLVWTSLQQDIMQINGVLEVLDMNSKCLAEEGSARILPERRSQNDSMSTAQGLIRSAPQRLKRMQYLICWTLMKYYNRCLSAVSGTSGAITDEEEYADIGSIGSDVARAQKFRGGSGSDKWWGKRRLQIVFRDMNTGPRDYVALAEAKGLRCSVKSVGSGFLIADRAVQMYRAEAQQRQRLLIISVALTVPIFVVSLIFPFSSLMRSLLEVQVVPGVTVNSVTLLLLATPSQFFVGKGFHYRAIEALRTKALTIDFLVSMGSFAAYFYSLWSSIILSYMRRSTRVSDANYFALSALFITIAMLGRFLETQNSVQTAEALHKLSRSKAGAARLVESGTPALRPAVPALISEASFPVVENCTRSVAPGTKGMRKVKQSYVALSNFDDGNEEVGSAATGTTAYPERTRAQLELIDDDDRFESNYNAHDKPESFLFNDSEFDENEDFGLPDLRDKSVSDTGEEYIEKINLSLSREDLSAIAGPLGDEKSIAVANGVRHFSAEMDGKLSRVCDKTNMQVINPAEGALEQRLEDESKDVMINSEFIHRGDILRLKVGDIVPADGILLLGSHIGLDESMMTGESAVVTRRGGENVFGGTTVVVGSALMKITACGEHSVLGTIVSTVQEAHATKPPISDINAKYVHRAVLLVVGMSLHTFIAWTIAYYAGLLTVAMYRPFGGPELLALYFALSVWVIASPPTYRLAQPIATLVANRIARLYGLSLRRASALLRMNTIGAVAFDKTGTLTSNGVTLTDFLYSIEDGDTFEPLSFGDGPNYSDLGFTIGEAFSSTMHLQEARYLMGLLLRAEQRTTHPLAKGICDYCCRNITAIDAVLSSTMQHVPNSLYNFSQDSYDDTNEVLDNKSVTENGRFHVPTEDEVRFHVIPGMGVHMYAHSNSQEMSPMLANHNTNTISGSNGQRFNVLVGSIKLLESRQIIIPTEAMGIATNYRAAGKIAVFMALNGVLRVIMGIAGSIRPEAADVVKTLQKRGINCYMITGDEPATALAIARTIGIEKNRILSRAKPADKKSFIETLRRDLDTRVMFIGDGTNDAPALATADVGFTMACGSEIALKSGDAVLSTNNLNCILVAFDLAAAVVDRIRANYFWAVIYNACLLPLAAGVLYVPYNVTLQPMFPAAAVLLSTISVFASSIVLVAFSTSFSTSAVESTDSSNEGTYKSPLPNTASADADGHSVDDEVTAAFAAQSGGPGERDNSVQGFVEETALDFKNHLRWFDRIVDFFADVYSLRILDDGPYYKEPLLSKDDQQEAYWAEKARVAAAQREQKKAQQIKKQLQLDFKASQAKSAYSRSPQNKKVYHHPPSALSTRFAGKPSYEALKEASLYRHIVATEPLADNEYYSSASRSPMHASVNSGNSLNDDTAEYIPPDDTSTAAAGEDANEWQPHRSLELLDRVRELMDRRQSLGDLSVIEEESEDDESVGNSSFYRRRSSSTDDIALNVGIGSSSGIIGPAKSRNSSICSADGETLTKTNFGGMETVLESGESDSSDDNKNGNGQSRPSSRKSLPRRNGRATTGKSGSGSSKTS